MFVCANLGHGYTSHSKDWTNLLRLFNLNNQILVFHISFMS